MQESRLITQDLIRDLISYEKQTGYAYWKERSREYFKCDGDWNTWNKNHALNQCSNIGTDSKSHKSYYRIDIFGKRFMLHRIIWLHEYGSMPDGQIDHIDGNGLNNRLSNLRDVTHKQNRKNSRKQSNNISGVSGVGWRDCKGKWRAYIKVDNSNIHLGYFNLFKDAVAARRSAEIHYGFHENHGSSRPL